MPHLNKEREHSLSKEKNFNDITKFFFGSKVDTNFYLPCKFRLNIFKIVVVVRSYTLQCL